MLMSTAGVATLEQAYIFLGVDANTNDDFVMTMFTAKVLRLNSERCGDKLMPIRSTTVQPAEIWQGAPSRSLQMQETPLP